MWEKRKEYFDFQINHSSFCFLVLCILYTPSVVLSCFHNSLLPKFYSKLTSREKTCLNLEALSIKRFVFEFLFSHSSFLDIW